MATSPTRRLAADDSAGPVKAISEQAPGIDEVPAGTDFNKLFAEEAFMAEPVTILLHPSQDQSEVGLPVSVNGKRVYLVPNRPTIIPRTHVAQLIKARPDFVIHSSDDYNAPEREQNRMHRQSTSRYNFEVLKDTPKGIAWTRELRSRYVQ